MSKTEEVTARSDAFLELPLRNQSKLLFYHLWQNSWGHQRNSFISGSLKNNLNKWSFYFYVVDAGNILITWYVNVTLQEQVLGAPSLGSSHVFKNQSPTRHRPKHTRKCRPHTHLSLILWQKGGGKKGCTSSRIAQWCKQKQDLLVDIPLKTASAITMIKVAWDFPIENRSSTFMDHCGSRGGLLSRTLVCCWHPYRQKFDFVPYIDSPSTVLLCKTQSKNNGVVKEVALCF